ncbi:hypothetical protein J6590_030041 [Homalodisca vitripennis]|nr:hypothetical protein J6590_030041 [Homalodisca vitripennis]
MFKEELQASCHTGFKRAYKDASGWLPSMSVTSFHYCSGLSTNFLIWAGTDNFRAQVVTSATTSIGREAVRVDRDTGGVGLELSFVPWAVGWYVSFKISLLISPQMTTCRTLQPHCNVRGVVINVSVRETRARRLRVTLLRSIH